MATQTKVLIVGGGIGGLTLACLLEKANIQYEIFEKASTFKPLGSAINLSCQVFTFLDQLGLYEDLEKVSKPFKSLHVHTLNSSKNTFSHQGTFSNKTNELDRFGYENRLLARSDLFEVLLSRIPKTKLHMGKKVIKTEQSEENDSKGVTIFCEDGTSYSGDLLIGADGTYSTIRKCLYNELMHKQQLPVEDTLAMEYDTDCAVGVTQPLDPKTYPTMNDPMCEFQVIMVDNQPVTIWLMPLTNRRLGWMVTEQINPLTAKTNAKQETDANNTEWRQTAALEMCKRFENQKTPYGPIFKDIVDHSPKELISKVMLESKYFETWQHGRIALMGDACHKVLPFAAQGGMQAMLDALQIANLLYDIKSNTYSELRKVLQEYYQTRKDFGKAAVEGSSMASQLLTSRGIKSNMMRRLLLNYMPAWMVRRAVEKLNFDRPQAIFLPWSMRSGKAPMVVQDYSERMMSEEMAKAREHTIRELAERAEAAKHAPKEFDYSRTEGPFVINGSEYMAGLKAYKEKLAAAKAAEEAAAAAAAVSESTASKDDPVVVEPESETSALSILAQETNQQAIAV